MGIEMTPTLETTTTAFTKYSIGNVGSQRDTQACQLPQEVFQSSCQWLKRVVDAVQSLPYNEANWDSYGSTPVDTDAGRLAILVLDRLSNIHTLEDFPPTISAAPSGEVLFCWDVGDLSLDITIDRTGLMTYVYLDHHNSNNDREQSTRDFDEIAQIVIRLPMPR